MKTVLVVDDDAPLRRVYQRIASNGRTAMAAGCARDALAIARREPIDLAVVDLVLHGESGIDLVQELANICPETISIVMSALLSADSTRRAFLAGAYDCVEKPLDWAAVLASVEEGLHVRSRPTEVPPPEQIKRECYAKLVEAHGGNISRSAAASGIDRRTLQRILHGARRKRSGRSLKR